MSKIWIIAARDIVDAINSKVTILYLAVLSLMPIPYFRIVHGQLNDMIREGQSLDQLKDSAQSFMNVATYTMPLAMAILICAFFSNYAIVMDKAKRTLDSLMAMPLSLRQIWLGKSVSVALPSLVLALTVSFFTIIILNISVISPKAHTFVIPHILPIMITITITPIVTFLVVAIVSFLQLTTSNPRITNLGFAGLFAGFYIYIQTVSQPSASSYFAVIYIMIMFGLLSIVVFLDRLLTKEKVVLSSRD